MSIGDGQESNLDREDREDESSIDEEEEVGTFGSRKGPKRGERDEPLMMIPRENNPVRRRKEVGERVRGR